MPNSTCAVLLAVVALLAAGCAADGGDLAPAATAESATAAIEDDAKWVATTRSGATITAEAPADDDHPLVEQAEEYREAAKAPEPFYVVVVFDNTDGPETLDVFEGGRVVTDAGVEVPVPHLAATGGVFETQIHPQLPLTMQEEGYDWFAEFHRHQAVAPGAVEEVVLATATPVSDVAEVHVLLDDDGREVELEPAS